MFQDIDECTLDRNACDSNQVCTNLAGGFQCDCKIGFTLDKVTNACVGKIQKENFLQFYLVEKIGLIFGEQILLFCLRCE